MSERPYNEEALKRVEDRHGLNEPGLSDAEWSRRNRRCVEDPEFWRASVSPRTLKLAVKFGVLRKDQV